MKREMQTAIRRLLSYYDAVAALARGGYATDDQRANALDCYRRAMQLIDKYHPYTINGRRVEQ